VRLLGTIIGLQVQVKSLKIGAPPQKRYDPAGIRQVERLGLSSDGVESWDDNGLPLADVHNIKHPSGKNRAGSNGISICFTSHYALMRRRFGKHLTDGIAGENILVDLQDSDEIFTEDTFENGIVIEGVDGGRITLQSVIVAPPCVEFSRWALRYPDEDRPDRTVTEAIQFLHEGTRGFYCSFAGSGVILRLGDQIFVP